VSELIALGTSYKTAPLALRERVALTDRTSERLLEELREQPDVHEAVVLSTCNRTELYLVVGDPVEAETAVVGMLARRAGLRPTELLGGVYSLRNCDAARHLYRVTGGLDSMVVGEAEVQGQVKRAYELALSSRTTGPLTNRLFRAALETGKRVRTETAISEGRNSVASVAVDLALDTLGALTDRHVLIVGAGETAELTAEALHSRGVATLFVANRRHERAQALARRFGGSTIAFDELPAALEGADIVVASTASPHALIEAEDLARVMVGREGRPLLLIDLAVPRDVDPSCAELPGVTVANIDDLRAVVDRHRLVRRAEARKAEGIVEEEIQVFAGWLGSLEVMPTIAALREHGDAIVRGVLVENEQKWESLSERDRARVEAIARAVAKRLLHEPTLKVKDSGAGHRHARMHLLRELFGLSESDFDRRSELDGTGGRDRHDDGPAAEVRELRPRGS
jgi:glutamyl-tRNA reductase